jgi:hypothetical protein
MSDPLVDAAIKGLAAIGIDVPPFAEGIIQLLIEAGEDVPAVLPRLLSLIEQLGAEAWTTLEQVASGMQRYGPVGYVQHLMTQAFSPHVETIRQIHQQKRALLAHHRATLSRFQTETAALFTHASPWQGQAAEQAQLHLAHLTAGVSAHLDLLEASLAIDQKFFHDYQNAYEAAADAALIALIIVCAVLAIALATAAFDGGLSLALAGGLLSITLSATECWLLAGMLACFVAWGTAHELLAHPLHLSWNPSLPAGPSLVPGTTQSGVGSMPATGEDAASIAAQIASSWGQARFWTDDEQQELAQSLSTETGRRRAQAVARYRQDVANGKERYDQRRDPSLASAAMIILFIADRQGRTVFNGVNFALGFKYAPPEQHAEAKLIEWAARIIATRQPPGILQEATINALIFSRTVVCSACRASLFSGQWIMSLYAATGQPPGNATVGLAVWQTSTDAGSISGVEPVYSATTNGVSISGSASAQPESQLIAV